MLKRIIQYLKEPFPYSHKKWAIVLVPTVWVFLILLITQPMGLTNANHKLEISLVIALITASVSALVAYIFPLIFKKFYNPNKWTRGKFLLVGLFIILIQPPIFIIAWDYIAQKENIQVINNPLLKLSTWYMVTFIIGVVPTFFLYFITEKLSLKKEFQIFSQSEDTDLKNIFLDDNEISITILGNTKDSLVLSPSKILYAEVIGNYVTIHFIKDDRVEKKSLRMTLSQIIEELSEYPEIVRCHRAFIVNTSNITNVRGNSQGYYLKLYAQEQEVPVSRSYIRIIKDKLNLE